MSRASLEGVIHGQLTPALSKALDSAIAAYKFGNLREAEQLCQQIVADKQDVFDALHLLALVQSLQGKKEAALATFDRALMVQPNNAEALSNRGLNLHELRRFQEALISFEVALTVQPDYAAALFHRGNSLLELRRLEEALTSFDRALKIRPNHTEALLNRGVTLNELRRFEEALANFELLLKFKQTMPRHSSIVVTPCVNYSAQTRRWRVLIARSGCGRTIWRRCFSAETSCLN